MKKSVKCAVLSLLMVCVFVFSLPLTALAAESYQMNINEPSKGDNQGYILLLCQYPNGSKYVQCISWTLLPIYTDSQVTYNATEMLIDISNSSSTISFIGRSNGAFQVSCGFGRSLNGDSSRTRYWSVYENETAIVYDYSLGSGNTVLGFQVYGNGSVSSHDLGSNNNIAFNVTWGDDSNSVSLLTKMLAELYTMVDNDETIIGQLNDLLGHAQTAEELLVSIDYWTNAINDKLQDIRLRVREIKDLLEQIVNAQGESTFEEPSTEIQSELNDKEDELMSGVDSDKVDEIIGDIEIDEGSNNLIWDIFDSFLNVNPKVFTLVISVLALGIIALVLNR